LLSTVARRPEERREFAGDFAGVAASQPKVEDDDSLTVHERHG
jgi:hypothetical protein